MSFEVSQTFDEFCQNLRMNDSVVDTVRTRYHRITERLNEDFWDSSSETQHSLYVGSYGRGTCIYTSDVDMVFQLPKSVYNKYDSYYSNGQSALLQSVKNSLKNTYSQTKLSGDGQVVVVDFSDGVTFEVVPAFLTENNNYIYPDSNDGGSWRYMNPRAELETFRKLDKECNGNLRKLCRMTRAWNEHNGVDMPGILIDTTAYRFMSNYEYKSKYLSYYDWMSRDYMKYLKEHGTQNEWVVPGSGWHIKKQGRILTESSKGYDRCVKAIQDAADGYIYTTHVTWREHYGSKFPSP